MKWLFLVVMVAGGVFFASCDELNGGPRKLIINELVCSDVAFLRMELGEKTRIVIDNTEHSDVQEGMSIILEEFPVRVTSELPPGSQVGANFTTIRVSVPTGEETSFDVQPIFTGQFTGQCNLQIADGRGGTILQKSLTFEIVDN